MNKVEPIQVGGARSNQDAVQAAVQQITELVANRQLVPGEQIRQEQLSQRLGLSRGPIREALQALSGQRLVRYERNRGYFVAQFSAHEMRQLYMLRAATETMLLRDLSEPTDEQLAAIEALQEEMRAGVQLAEFSRLNEAFHLAIFELSSLALIRHEVERWWKMISAYRVLGIGFAGFAKILDDHDQLIDALKRHDLEEMVEISNVHRALTESALLPLLPD